MAEQHDLIIRGGTVVDGTGAAPYIADVAIDDGTIVAVGEVSGRGTKEICADGLLVTPGFVDIHTHYDAQAIWSSRLSPTSGHGVTTVVIGNCGVGFAPCKPADRDRLIELMEGVEDIPGVVLKEGLTWEWESYPEYLDALARRQYDVNVASYLPHAALRVFVMGKRALYKEVATEADLIEMATLTREAVKAGALGVATSRTLFHRSSSGAVIPTADATEAELTALAQAMQSEDAGILHIATDYNSGNSVADEFAMMERVLRSSGRPLTLPTTEIPSHPGQWREVLRLVGEANRNGLKITCQGMTRALGMLLGLELTLNPFSLSPSYRAIEHLPLAQRVEMMRDPALRAKILADELSDPTHPFLDFVRDFDGMYEANEPLNYEPEASESLGARAAQQGRPPAELAYDLLLKNGGHSIIFRPFSNYSGGNLDAVGEMLTNEHFVPGLGDGGAHCGVICDASYSTFLLSHWTRDRTRGFKIDLPTAVKALTHDTARVVSLADRGLLAPGYRADINVIDYDKLLLHSPRVSHDLPKGGRRLTQRAEGYVYTIVDGLVTYEDGSPTGALPGRLVRGAQPAPSQRRDEAPV